MRRLPTLVPADLERRLFAKGVGALAAGRDRCADCGRTPLPGERVDVYRAGVRVCALCSPRRPEQPSSSERVLHSEHGHAVRLRAA